MGVRELCRNPIRIPIANPPPLPPTHPKVGGSGGAWLIRTGRLKFKRRSRGGGGRKTPKTNSIGKRDPGKAEGERVMSGGAGDIYYVVLVISPLLSELWTRLKQDAVSPLPHPFLYASTRRVYIPSPASTSPPTHRHTRKAGSQKAYRIFSYFLY